MNIWWRFRRAIMGERNTNRRFSDRYSLVEPVSGDGERKAGHGFNGDKLKGRNRQLGLERRERTVPVSAIILLSVAVCSLIFSVTVMNTIGKDVTVVVVVEDHSDNISKEQTAGLKPSITIIKEAVVGQSGQDEDVMRQDVLGNKLGGLPISAP